MVYTATYTHSNISGREHVPGCMVYTATYTHSNISGREHVPGCMVYLHRLLQVRVLGDHGLHERRVVRHLINHL